MRKVVQMSTAVQTLQRYDGGRSLHAGQGGSCDVVEPCFLKIVKLQIPKFGPNFFLTSFTEYDWIWFQSCNPTFFIVSNCAAIVDRVAAGLKLDFVLKQQTVGISHPCVAKKHGVDTQLMNGSKIGPDLKRVQNLIFNLDFGKNQFTKRTKKILKILTVIHVTNKKENISQLTKKCVFLVMHTLYRKNARAQVFLTHHSWKFEVQEMANSGYAIKIISKEFRGEIWEIMSTPRTILTLFQVYYTRDYNMVHFYQMDSIEMGMLKMDAICFGGSFQALEYLHFSTVVGHSPERPIPSHQQF